jgi:NAD(P)-dependent dehydrogenase (short-subunit alcohol dehydrogenase family)
MNLPLSFKDKSVFVSGGSSGINLGIALAFAQAGARVAMEWGPEGVRVNSIVPGPIGGTEGIRRLAPTPEAVRRMTDSVPLQRMGRVQEIADMALFLTSSYASFSFVTGAIIPVDGGSSLAGARDYSGAFS